MRNKVFKKVFSVYVTYQYNGRKATPFIECRAGYLKIKKIAGKVKQRLMKNLVKTLDFCSCKFYI